MNQNKIQLSIIVPVYNEVGNLPELYKRFLNVLEKELKITYEIIFVDDGSKDNSWNIIEDLHNENNNIKGIKFSRNFGHQYALKAGIDQSKGKAVISIDADLQQPPELVEKMYKKWKDGYQIVNMIRKETKGISFLKRFTSNLYYWIINNVSDIKLNKGSSDLRLLDRKVIEEIIKMNELQFFLRGIVNWVGFESVSIDYIADERLHGETKYTLGKMIKFAISGLMSFSVIPLRISIYLGFFVSTISIFYGIYIILAKLIIDKAVPGWTTNTFAILLLGSLILIVLGIIGEYIAKIYECLTRRPKYIIANKIGL